MRVSQYLVLMAFALTACSPTFNWRDVRPNNTRLLALLPCKPVAAERSVPFSGLATVLRLLSCDAGGVTFAVAAADVKDISRVDPALRQWQSATLAQIKAAANTPTTAFKLTGADMDAGKGAGAVMVSATGLRANGQAVSSQAVYFAQGTQVFQAVIYADKISPEVADTFFSGLKFE